MIQLRYLILAKYAEYTPVGMLNIIGGDLDRIPVPAFPAVIPHLTVALRLDFDYEQACKGMTIRFRVTKFGSDLALSEAMLVVDPQVLPEAYKDRAFDLAKVVTLHRIPVQDAGFYIIGVHVDDRLVGHTSTKVDLAAEIAKGWRSEFRGGSEYIVTDDSY